METNTLDDSTNGKRLIVKSRTDNIIVPVIKIVYCEADGSYTIIKLEDGSEIYVSRSLHVLEKELDEKKIIRCHHSYLVNIMKAERYCRNTRSLIIRQYRIPVSRRRCHDTLIKLKSISNRV